MKIEFEQLNTASAVVYTAGGSIKFFNGMFRGAANRWLQLHDAKARPADTAVPLRIWPLYATSPFEQNFDGKDVGCVNGMVFVVSSTQGTLTYDAASTMDLFVIGDGAWDNTGVLSAGDYTTGGANLDIYAAEPTRVLMRLEFTRLSDAGTDLYWKVYPFSAVSYDAGMLPFREGKLIRNTSSDVFFNTNITGVEPTLAGGARQTSLSVIIDSAPGPLIGDYIGTDYAIKATYK